MQRTVRRAHNIGAADSQLDLDGIAEEIFPAEFRRCQRLPDLLSCRGDIDRIDDGRLEAVDVHDRYISSSSSIDSASNGMISGWPVSSILFRLDMIAGHPLEMPSRITLFSAKSSCISVSFTSLPCGSSTKVTRDGRSLRAASFR